MTRFFCVFINVVIAILLSACFFEPLDFDEKKWLEIVKSTDSQDLYAENSKDGVFYNPWLTQEDRGFSDFLRWRFSKTPSYSVEAQNNTPQVIPDLLERIALLDSASDFIVWIGHATFLFRVQGEYWLTDPIFSDRALLPKRLTPPALRAHDLASLRGNLHVVISHGHYDHLDKNSIRDLPENASIYVPKGLGEYVAKFAPGTVTEMNWWDELDLGKNIKLFCLPAQHWSRRIFQGYNTTLWASYMVSAPDRLIYFGGDSGYFKGYKEIGKKFNTIDYALLPITAYDPRWFMHYAHMDTKEAIRAFDDLGAKYFVPTQWGTFHLGDNPPGLPALDLQRDVKDMKLDPEKFLTLDIGQIQMM